MLPHLALQGGVTGADKTYATGRSECSSGYRVVDQETAVYVLAWPVLEATCPACTLSLLNLRANAHWLDFTATTAL